MTGPSLRIKNAHHSIHNGIYTEARDLTNLLKKFFAEKNETYIKEISEALIEHWETRTLAHASSEEEGLFIEKVKEKPELKDKIIKLRRDHELLHLIVQNLKEKFAEDGITEKEVACFDTLIVLFQIHNQEEERYLFTPESQ